MDKENTLKENIKEIAEMDEALMIIDEQINELQHKIKQRNEKRIEEKKLDDSLQKVSSENDIRNDSTFEPYEVQEKSESHQKGISIKGSIS